MSYFTADFTPSDLAQAVAQDVSDLTKTFALNVYNQIKYNLIQSAKEIFNYYFSSLIGSIFGAIFGPFLIIRDFLRQYWDPFIQQVTNLLIMGRTFFDDVQDIPKYLLGGFGDTLSGVLPGTLYQRPLQKHPLLPSESDIHRISRSDDSVRQPGGMKYLYDKERDELLRDPPMDYDPTYPYDHYFETESGHAWEYDDTPSFERIQLKHRSGTGFHINPDGSEKITITGSRYTVVLHDDKLRVRGDIETYIDGSAKVSINGDAVLNIGLNADISVGKNLSFDVGENFSVKAKNITFDAAKGKDEFEDPDDLVGELLDSSSPVDLAESAEKTKKQPKKVGLFSVKSSGIDLNAKEMGDPVDVKPGHINITAEKIVDIVGLIAILLNENYRLPKVQEGPEIEDTHEVKEYIGYRYRTRYEGIEKEVPARKGSGGSGSRISTASVKDGLQKGELSRAEMSERMPDAVVPTEEDKGEFEKGSPPAGWSVPAPKKPNNPRDEGYDQKISKHFYLRDLCISPHASQNKYLRGQNKFSLQQIVDRLCFLAQVCLDPIYEMYDGCSFGTYGRKSGRLMITSGFRIGSGSSWHLKGSAVDIQLKDVAKGNYYHEAIKIRDKIKGFDAILLEYKTDRGGRPWIHLQARPEASRGNCQTYMNDSLYANKFVNLAAKSKK